MLLPVSHFSATADGGGQITEEKAREQTAKASRMSNTAEPKKYAAGIIIGVEADTALSSDCRCGRSGSVTGLVDRRGCRGSTAGREAAAESIGSTGRAPLILLAVVQAVLTTQVEGRTAAKLFYLLITNTLAAICIGLLVANLLRPGVGSDLPPPEDLPAKAQGNISSSCWKTCRGAFLAH